MKIISLSFIVGNRCLIGCCYYVLYFIRFILLFLLFNLYKIKKEKSRAGLLNIKDPNVFITIYDKVLL